MEEPIYQNLNLCMQNQNVQYEIQIEANNIVAYLVTYIFFLGNQKWRQTRQSKYIRSHDWYDPKTEPWPP